MNTSDLRLHDYNLIIINSSAGKDSLCAMYEIYKECVVQNYPFDKVWVSHQDLGESEWGDVKATAKLQAKHFFFNFITSERVDKNGNPESLLEYAKRRGKWPSSKQRWCTSDYKRGPGARIVTKLSKDFVGKHKFLYVFGFRAEESSSRKKKPVYHRNERLTTKMREVFEFLPIHKWTAKDVWWTIRTNNLPYHYAYNLGMPRLSCVFCIFAPKKALLLAGYHNPELLTKYVEVEDMIGHTFRENQSLREIKEILDKGEYSPTAEIVEDWRM